MAPRPEYQNNGMTRSAGISAELIGIVPGWVRHWRSAPTHCIARTKLSQRRGVELGASAVGFVVSANLRQLKNSFLLTPGELQ
jgi:hypothetical protein